MVQDEFNDYLKNYYRRPDPDRAPAALTYVISQDQADPANPGWYFFSKIAERKPAILRRYEQIFQALPQGREFLLLILSQIGDETTVRFLKECAKRCTYPDVQALITKVLDNWSPGHIQPLKTKPTSGADLDLLWYEFFATGNPMAITSIVDVLERPDTVREKLNAWLASASNRGFIARWRNRRSARNLAGEGILVDMRHVEILSSQDLDCHCALDNHGSMSRERVTRMCRVLPFPLSQAELEIMALKGAAKWSLGANSRDDVRVREICEAESTKRTGRARFSLLEVCAASYAGDNDLESAFGKLHEALTSDVGQRTRQIASFENALAEMKELPNAGDNIPDEQFLILKNRCLDQMTGLTAYRSRLSVATIHPDGVGAAPGENSWILQLEMVKPATYWVTQQIGRDFDEWVTLYDTTFRAPMWSAKAAAGNEPALNDMLVVDRYLDLLRAHTPISAHRRILGDVELVVVIFGTPGKAFLPKVICDNDQLMLDKIYVVICQRTAYLTRVEATGRIETEGRLESLRMTHDFGSFNEPINIVAPPFQLIV